MSSVKDLDGNWESVFKALLDMVEPKFVPLQEQQYAIPGAVIDYNLKYCPGKTVYDVDMKLTDDFAYVKGLVSQVYNDFFAGEKRQIGESHPTVASVGVKVYGEYAKYIAFLWHVAYKLGYTNVVDTTGVFPVLSCGQKTQGKMTNMWCLCCGMQLSSLQQVQEHVQQKTASFYVHYLTKSCAACDVKYDSVPGFDNLTSANHLFSHNHSTMMNAVLAGDTAYSIADGRIVEGYSMPHALMARLLTTLSIRSAPVGTLDNVYEMTQENYNQNTYIQMSVQAELQAGNFENAIWTPQESNAAYTFMPVHYLDAFRMFAVYRDNQGKRVFNAEMLKRYAFIPFIQSVIKRIQVVPSGPCKVFRNSFNDDDYRDDDKNRDRTKVQIRSMVFKNNITETKNTDALYTSSAPTDGWQDMLKLIKYLTKLTDVETKIAGTPLVVEPTPIIEFETPPPTPATQTLDCLLEKLAEEEQERQENNNLVKKHGAYYDGSKHRTLIPYKVLLPLYRMFLRTGKKAEQFIQENERLIQPKVNSRKMVYNVGNNWMYRHGFHTNIAQVAQQILV